jgi:hypothetical protein
LKKDVGKKMNKLFMGFFSLLTIGALYMTYNNRPNISKGDSSATAHIGALSRIVSIRNGSVRRYASSSYATSSGGK